MAGFKLHKPEVLKQRAETPKRTATPRSSTLFPVFFFYLLNLFFTEERSGKLIFNEELYPKFKTYSVETKRILRDLRERERRREERGEKVEWRS